VTLNPVQAATVANTAVQEHHAIQQVDELSALVCELSALTPHDIAIEIGCDAGGTLWAWRQVFRQVYGITLPAGQPPPGSGEGMFPMGKHPLTHHGALVYLGNSHVPTAQWWLQQQLGDRKADFLFIDGDHDPDAVIMDYQMYSPLVRPGGLIAIDDVLNPDLRVKQAWRFITRHARVEYHVIKGKQLPAGIGVIVA
jgi:hypothetical protein